MKIKDKKFYSGFVKNIEIHLKKLKKEKNLRSICRIMSNIGTLSSNCIIKNTQKVPYRFIQNINICQLML